MCHLGAVPSRERPSGPTTASGSYSPRDHHSLLGTLPSAGRYGWAGLSETQKGETPCLNRVRSTRNERMKYTIQNIFMCDELIRAIQYVIYILTDSVRVYNSPQLHCYGCPWLSRTPALPAPQPQL